MLDIHSLLTNFIWKGDQPVLVEEERFQNSREKHDSRIKICEIPEKRNILCQVFKLVGGHIKDPDGVLQTPSLGKG